ERFEVCTGVCTRRAFPTSLTHPNRVVEPNRRNHPQQKGPYGIRTRAAAVRGRCPRPLDEWAASPRQCSEGSNGDFAEQRRGVERVVPEPHGDFFARELRALTEEIGEELAGLGIAPPVLADRVD